MATMDGITPVTGIQGVPATDNIIQGSMGPGRRSSAENTTAKIAVEDFVLKMQAVLSSTNVSVGFAKYGNNKTAVVVYSKETGKVIREIPPKEIQQLQLRMEEIINTIGVIFNNTV